MTEDVVRIVVPGAPKGWSRPADSPFGGRHRFTPKKQRTEQNLIGLLASRAMGNKPPFTGPIDLRVGAFFDVPKSWSKAKRAAALRGAAHKSKPDADNICKLLKDALNNVVWVDDAQVSDLSIRKRYSDTARLVIEIRAIQEEDDGATTAKAPTSIWGP